MEYQYNTFTDKTIFVKELQQTVRDTGELYNKLNHLFHEDLYCIDKQSYHFIKSFLAPKNKTENVLFSALLNSITQTELISGNSSYFSLMFGFEFLKNLSRNTQLIQTNELKLQQEFKIIWENLRTKTQELTKQPTKEAINKVISTICENDIILSEALKKAVEIAGLEGKIFIENGKTSNYIIEQKEGYSFDLNPFAILLPKFANSDAYYKRYNPKVLVVDGVIEQVSEIDQLLQKANETKQALVIIAHGFSEEVVATCKANNDQQNFDVMPIRLKTDVQSINQINDIGVVCGMIPVSYLMGQMLSFIKWDDLPTVEEINCNKKETVIINSATRSAVSSQIKSIIEKKQNDFLVEDIQSILDKRLKTLVASSVIVHLPDVDAISNETIRVKIDLTLRNIKTVLTYGTIDFNQLINNLSSISNSEMEKCFLKTLRNIQPYYNTIPSVGLLLGTLLVGKTSVMLLSSSGVIA